MKIAICEFAVLLLCSLDTTQSAVQDTTELRNCTWSKFTVFLRGSYREATENCQILSERSILIYWQKSQGQLICLDLYSSEQKDSHLNHTASAIVSYERESTKYNIHCKVMPKQIKQKQYSLKYRRRLAQQTVHDIEKNLQTHHASDEMPHLDNRDSYVEENVKRADCFSQIVQEEMIQEVLQDEEEVMQEERIREELISSDEYDSDLLSESEDENNGINIDRLRQNLVKWIHTNNIFRSAITALLKVLKVEDPMKSLPADARTLLKTPRKSETIPMEHGRYIHFGIAEGLHHVIETSGTIACIPEEIHLSFNIDGLPLTKSSKSQLWTILGSFRNFKNKLPFIIGAFHGYKKPPADAKVFLKYFVEEADSLIENGYTWKGINSKFIIDCFICDAPARAYISCIKSHGGYYACGKCETKGKYLGKVVYPEMDAPLRTAESFATQSQPEHHIGISPLMRLNIDMVSQMPYDYMHLVALGHIKRILKIMTGKLNPMKLGAQQVSDISERQLELRQHIPFDFVRKPRALDELDRMKATEHREHLFYTGPVVLRKIVRSDIYNHFIKLSVAMRLLATPGIDFEQNRYAKGLLQEYFVEFLQLYGEENATYNTHGLLHLADDALQWGALDEFSAFTFENYLQHIKKLVRGNDKPLEQLSNRIYEIRNSHCVESFNDVISTYKLGKKCYNGTVIGECTSPMHKDIQFKNFKITTKRPNNYCIMTDESVVMVENICYRNNSVIVIGRKLKNGKPFFHSPAPSTCFGIIQFSQEYGSLQTFPITNIKNKAVVLPIFDQSNESEGHHRNVVAFPLIHGH